MPRKALIVKANKVPKFKVRSYTRCRECKRSGSVFSKYNLCRIDMKRYIDWGRLPGFRKASF